MSHRLDTIKYGKKGPTQCGCIYVNQALATFLLLSGSEEKNDVWWSLGLRSWAGICWAHRVQDSEKGITHVLLKNMIIQ